MITLTIINKWHERYHNDAFKYKQQIYKNLNPFKVVIELKCFSSFKNEGRKLSFSNKSLIFHTKKVHSMCLMSQTITQLIYVNTSF